MAHTALKAHVFPKALALAGGLFALFALFSHFLSGEGSGDDHPSSIPTSMPTCSSALRHASACSALLSTSVPTDALASACYIGHTTNTHHPTGPFRSSS
jgi:hypothetical protein